MALNRVPDKLRDPCSPDLQSLAFFALCLFGGLLARRFHWMLAPALVIALQQVQTCVAAGRFPSLTQRRGLALLPGLAALLLLGSLYHVELRVAGRPLHRSLAAGSYGQAIDPSLQLPELEFLRHSGLEGNAFCDYGSGGILSYHLHPRIRVFIDSRIDLFRRGVFLDFLAIRAGHRHSQARLDRYQTDIYCQHWGLPAPPELQHWDRVFAGGGSQVWLRKGPRNAANRRRIAALRRTAPATIPPR